MRLIDAYAVAERIRDEIFEAHGIEAFHGFIVGLRLALAYVYAAETVDAAPVRHGKWENNGGRAMCSECGETTPWLFASDYCGHCGAKMEADDETD